MQSLSGYCSRSYSQIPGAQRSTEEWGTGRNWTLLDLIHGLHLALRVIEQCNRKIEPDRYKSVISGMPNPFFRADQQNYARFVTYYSRHATFLGWQSVFLTKYSVRIRITNQIFQLTGLSY